MKFKILYLVLLFTYLLNAQPITQLKVITQSGAKQIPVYDREGTIYFSLKPFAEALGIDYLSKPMEKKIELNFINYKIYITAQNPFVILYDKKNDDSKVFQLPTSSYFLHDQIFLPLIYSIDILQKASGLKLDFQKPDKLVVNGGKINKQSNENEPTKIKNNEQFDISGLSIEEKANGTLVRVISKKKINSYTSSFRLGVLKIVFRNVNANVEAIDTEGGQGLIQWIKAKNIKSDTEILFGLSKNYTTSEVLNVDKSNDVLIALHNKIFNISAVKKNEREKWNFNVIVIDPGHGGKDSGTIGIDGIEEKNINLAIALKLGKDIEENMKDVKVVFTRKNDTFVELYRRGQIANEHDGNLFISIHCNATPQKPSNSNGEEVYLLRPGRTKEAISIAERENSVINYESNPSRYKKLTDENFILVSMAQSAYMRYSEKFADIVNNEFGMVTNIAPRGVKQAGFYVLVGASMPSVLVETGFLSNRKDALYLNSKKGQDAIADAIFQAIKKYKSLYEKNIDAE